MDNIKKLCDAAESNEKLFWKLLKGQRSTTQMSAFLTDEKLITDKSDIRDMWADHFEDLGKPNLQLAVPLIMTFPIELPIVSAMFLHHVKTNCPVP